jgi:hypothetical protein
VQAVEWLARLFSLSRPPADEPEEELPPFIAKKVVELSGGELEEALKAWQKEEYKQVATQPYDLGKFLLGVSSATITVTSGVATLIKANLGAPAWLGFGTGTILQVFAAVIAMSLVLPFRYPTGSDIRDLYIERIQRVIYLAWIWAALWLTAITMVTLSLILGRAHT